MIRRIIGVATVVATVAIPAIALGQGGPGGTERGDRGKAAPGRAVIGGTGVDVGGAAGSTAGVLGTDQRPRFRSYVVERHTPSYRYDREVRVGAVLPERGVTYYEVPQEYGVTNYRYTVVNDRTVLVEPHTRRIVQIIE
jgi:hypothetical protein